jgi:hypothetical protein
MQLVPLQRGATRGPAGTATTAAELAAELCVAFTAGAVLVEFS